MAHLRTFLNGNRHFAALLIVAALCLKALLPTGFMIQHEARTFSIAVCQDASGGSAIHDLVIPMEAKSDSAPGEPRKGECPFGALSMATLGGADVALLALALAFILALGFAPQREVPRRREHFLRPPLRGPPLAA